MGTEATFKSGDPVPDSLLPKRQIEPQSSSVAFKVGDPVPDSLLPKRRIEPQSSSVAFKAGDPVPDNLLPKPKSFFSTSGPKKKEAGFFSSLYEQATILGLADEAAAFTANPTEENRKAFIDAGNSKYESAGGFDTENKISLRNWRALKETAGGSLGALVAPAAAATVVESLPMVLRYSA